MPIRQVLESGQKVEVLTSAKQQPSGDWLNIVVSSHARSKIRQSLKEMQNRESAMGREMLERKLRNRKLEWDETVINILIKKLGYKEAADFFRDIVDEKIETNTLVDNYIELQKFELGQGERAATVSAENFSMDSMVAQNASQRSGSDDVLVIDENLKGIEFCMAKCCSPVFGDTVFGFVTTGGGIKIHRDNCPNAPELIERFPYRIVRARWATRNSKNTFPAVIHVIGNDDLGIVNNLTSIISKDQHIMLRNINIESRDGLFYGELTVLIEDNLQLRLLIRKLQTVRGVKAVSR